MSSDPARTPDALSPFEQLRLARQVIEQESRTLLDIAQRLDSHFCRAVDYLYTCRGSVIVCGMGKAGLVGQKIMATLASTGTRSHYLHPAEAVHGDLGRVHPDDVMLILSQSGETEEIVRILPSLDGSGCRRSWPSRPGPTALWGGRPRSCWNSGRSTRPARWGWLPPPAPPRCWPSATPWRW